MAEDTAKMEDVRSVLVKVLGIQDRAGTLDASTPLFGSIPELDSLAVVELAAALEERFGFEINDDDFTGDVFETLGSLTQFVEQSRS